MTEDQMRWLKRNRVIIAGEIDRNTLMYVRQVFEIKMGEGSPDLTVHISSNGGNVSNGLDVYDLLKFYPGKKIGVVQGFAASTAAVILQVCDWRTATTYSDVLIHHVSNQNLRLDVARDPIELAKFIQKMEDSQSKLYDILVGRTGKTLEEIRDTCKLDEPMPAPAALSYGLIDQVIATESDIRAPWMVQSLMI